MRGIRLPSASVRFTCSSVSPKVRLISSTLRPSFTSRVKPVQFSTSDGLSRAKFSISGTSSAAASSPAAMTAHGNGSMPPASSATCRADT